MKNYNEIKRNHEKIYNDLIEKHKIFFAFSNEQLEEGKKKIGVKDNKELASLGMGGFGKKEDIKLFFEEADKEDKRYKAELKEARKAKEEAILYELNNHECFYTGEIDDVANIFKGIYNTKDIWKVFMKHKEDQHATL